MRQIREILRQNWEVGLSQRAVAQSLRIGLGTVSSVVQRAHGARLDGPPCRRSRKTLSKFGSTTRPASMAACGRSPRVRRAASPKPLGIADKAVLRQNSVRRVSG